ncbi:MAG: 5-methylthioribose/5-deoxyribulose 1-phosphate isomerase [Methanophagales archaeon]|nr:S-methyl-5-thioribose-1-phosphate isomerase [Methanophagales archaeon]MCU4140681.1 5-methylthioribose/5-deoxyribulose 1-phosphate isomerase [Methanophagales archaeon]
MNTEQCEEELTIWWDEEAECVKMIDQTLLPREFKVIECRTLSALKEAILKMRVRGAPALAVAGAFGVVLACKEIAASSQSQEALKKAVAELANLRPTAVNLSYGVQRAFSAALRGGTAEEMFEEALKEAKKMLAEDLEVNKKIGENGAKLLKDGDVVLTHCNAGRLACVGWGTALGIIRTAVLKEGKRIHVFACETRPLNQGSRLTAWELLKDGIPVTLIADSASAKLMRDGVVDCVLVGADRVVKDGFFNKIGTYMHAVIAKEHSIPFYVAAPLSSFDLRRSEKDVKVEERGKEELIFVGREQIAPLNVDVRNPAFDFTPLRFVSAFVTEKGVFRPEDLENLEKSIQNGSQNGSISV